MSRVLQACLALAVIVAAAYMGRRPSVLYIGLPIVLLSAAIVIRYPQIGLLAIIPGSLVVPFAIGTGSDSPLHAGVLILAAMLGLWLLEMLTRREIRLVKSPTILALIAFIFAIVISFISGQLPWYPVAGAPLRAQIGGLAIFLLSASAFLLVSHQVRDLCWLRWMTWLFLALGAIHMTGRLVPGYDGYLDQIFQGGAQGATGSLFWAWVIALAFSQAMYNRQLPLVWRVALGWLVVATLYISLVQHPDWTSGWAPALLAIVVVLWVGSPKLGLLATLIGVGIVFVKQQSVISYVDVGDTDYSIMTRLEAWKVLAEIVSINPITGLGPANYYWYTPLFLILGYTSRFSSHNNYVDLIAQTGLLGLLCFVWFAWEVGRLGWRLRTRAPKGFAQAYVYGALGGLVATLAAGMLGDWFLPFVYNIGLNGFRSSVLGWLFLGGLLAIDQIIQTQTLPDSNRDS